MPSLTFVAEIVFHSHFLHPPSLTRKQKKIIRASNSKSFHLNFSEFYSWGKKTQKNTALDIIFKVYIFNILTLFWAIINREMLSVPVTGREF